jgi:hypothetical protein
MPITLWRKEKGDVFVSDAKSNYMNEAKARFGK